MSRAPTAHPRPTWAAALWAGLAVGAAVVVAVSAGGEIPVLLGTAVTRSGMDVAGVACVGLTLLGVLLPAAGREAAPVQATADRALVVVGGVWLGLVLLATGFRSAAAYGRPVTDVVGGEVITFITQVPAGRGLVLTACCAAVALGCGVARLRDPALVPARMPLIAALLGVLTPAVTGHAGSSPDHQLAVITVGLHVAAASLWVGGLGALLVFLARRRTLLDAALPRFSLLAGVCVVAVGVTGLANAALRVASFDALFTTGYGLLVVAKTVLLVALAGLGALARRRLAAGRTPVLRWAGIEVALMAVTLGLAAALTQSA